MIQTEAHERIVYLTLNRPDKRNALNPQMVSALKTELSTIEQDANIRAVVIKGAGDVFCAGADLAHLQTLQTNSYEENLADSNALMELFEQLIRFPKITIAQVHGAAIAGGAGLATACDFCFMASDAKIGYTEVKIGFIPAIVSTFFVHKFGEALARKLLLSGKVISGEEALQNGLITDVFPQNELGEKVNIFVSQVVKATSPTSIAMTKDLLWNLKGKDLATSFKMAAEYNARSRESEDCKKGIESFLNKKKISW